LKPPMDWKPTDPTRESRRQKVKPSAPTTRVGVVLQGLRRFALISAGLAGAIALISALIVWRSDASSSRVFPIAFYIGGALLGASAFLGGTGTYEPEYWNRRERERAFNMSFAYAAFGVVLIGIGVMLESVL